MASAPIQSPLYGYTSKMPNFTNEPLSFLQRLVEYMEYTELLKKANEEPDSCLRIQYVAAFAVSAVSSNRKRTGKPFNPLLGETYELIRDDFKVICEQVSHHPPISAFHAESSDFVFHGSINPKFKFWGKNVEIQPEGIVTAELKKWREVYTWSNVLCCVHNVVVGKIWIEQSGTMEIISHMTGIKAALNFKSEGWFSKGVNRVEGFIIDRDKRKLMFLYGKWSEYMKSTDMKSYEQYVKENSNKFKFSDYCDITQAPQTPKKVLAKFNSFKMGSSMFKSMSLAEPATHERDEDEDGEQSNGELDENKSEAFELDIPNSTVLWEAHASPSKSAVIENGEYQFSDFTKSLNKLEPEMIGKICSTDSRYRPDVRKLEENDLEGSAAEKNRLEEKQREARSFRKRKKIPEWSPRWFYSGFNRFTNQDDWYFNGKYWDRDFSPDPDIF